MPDCCPLLLPGKQTSAWWKQGSAKTFTYLVSTDPIAISMETVAASQWQRGYHSLTNAQCGYQLMYFRYPSTRIQLSATPNNLLSLQQESLVLKSIYNVWLDSWLGKGNSAFLPLKAKRELKFLHYQNQMWNYQRGMDLSLHIQCWPQYFICSQCYLKVQEKRQILPLSA